MHLVCSHVLPAQQLLVIITRAVGMCHRELRVIDHSHTTEAAGEHSKELQTLIQTFLMVKSYF